MESFVCVCVCVCADIGGGFWVRGNERKKSVPVIRDPTTRDAKVKTCFNSVFLSVVFCISRCIRHPFPPMMTGSTETDPWYRVHNSVYNHPP